MRKSLEAEAKGAKIETVTKEKGDDDQTVFWAEVKLDGRPYAIGVLEDGTLSETEPRGRRRGSSRSTPARRPSNRPSATSRSARKSTPSART